MARLVALAAVLVAALALGAAAGDDAVVKATSDNWATAVADEDLALVEFFAPWCGHCKTLAPKFEAAAKKLKDVAPLVSVDCTVETELCNQYEVRGYPTLKLFRNNVPSDYTGERETDGIVRFIKKQIQPAITTIASGEFDDFVASDKVVVVAFAPTSSELYSVFARVAEQNRMKFSFGHTSDESVAKAAGATVPSIVLFKSFDEGKNVYSGEIDESDLLEFIKAKATPIMDDIGPENYNSYVESGLPLAYLFVSSEGEREAVGQQVKVVANEFKGKVNFVFIDAVKYGGHAANINLQSKWPAFAIHKPKENLKYPFDQTKDITESEIRKFVKAFVDGELQPNVKSEPVPEDNSGPVTVVVGTQYKEIVNSDKDVLIEFYAPWCGHCKKLVPIYDELGAKLKPFSSSIVIAKMDATANDLPEGTPFSVSGFPTIKLVKADNTVVDYNGDRTVEDFVSFLQKNAVHGKKIKLDEAANSSQSAHDHDHDHDEL